MARSYADVVKVLNAAGCKSTLVSIMPDECTVAPAGDGLFTKKLSVACNMIDALKTAGFTLLPTLHTLGIRVRF